MRWVIFNLVFFWVLLVVALCHAQDLSLGDDAVSLRAKVAAQAKEIAELKATIAKLQSVPMPDPEPMRVIQPAPVVRSSGCYINPQGVRICPTTIRQTVRIGGWFRR